MPQIEDEINKLTSEIDKFLAEEGDGDSGDEGSGAEATTLRPKPGAITPLGVRVDRGTGLLGANGATATIGEMDSTLANIRAWKQKHEREMLEMRQRNEQALQAQTAGGPSDAQPSAQPGAPTAGAPTQRPSQQATGPGADAGVSLGGEEDADLQELVRERRERQERLVSGMRQKYSAAEEGSGRTCGREGSGSDGAAAHALMKSSVIRASVCSVDQPPLESLLRHVDVRSMVDSSAAAAVGARATYLPGGASGVLDRPVSAARKKAETAANEAVLRGQQLMAELEAELRALEGPAGAGAGGAGGAAGGAAVLAGAGGSSFTRPGSGGGPLGATSAGRVVGLTDGDGRGVASSSAAESEVPLDPLLDWSVQLQGVLAKMDALQTGYQAAAMAAARGGADEGAGSSRPGSGAGAGIGAGASMGGVRTGSASSLMPPRPGSARIKLEPLPQAQALLAAAVVAASAGASGGAGRRPGSGGSATAAGGGKQEQEAEEPEEGAAPEPVPFAGNRIRQLREMQRQDSSQ